MKLYQVECDPVCGFKVTSHNDKETIRLAMEHVADSHPEKDVTTSDVKKMMKTM